MPRTLSASLTAAISEAATTPIYLARLGFATESYVSSWGEAISFDGESYIASGMSVTRLDDTRATIELPTTDAWLGLVLGEGVRDKAIYIYRHYRDIAASPSADTLLLFQGVMDAARIEDRIRIECIEARAGKQFPPGIIDRPTFRFLPRAGDTITWGGGTITVT